MSSLKALPLNCPLDGGSQFFRSLALIRDGPSSRHWYSVQTTVTSGQDPQDSR